MELSTIDIIERLHSELPPKRFMHTLGVAVTAAQLASCNDYDRDKAYLTGLLHDCAKGIPTERIISTAENYGIELTEIERFYPGELIHAKLGAYLAEREYGFTDNEILQSIRYHTTARPAMGMLEKIIYISDYIEPGRKMPTIPSLDEIRCFAFKDVDVALRMILRNVMKYLRENYSVIDELTIQTYDYYMTN